VSGFPGEPGLLLPAIGAEDNRDGGKTRLDGCTSLAGTRDPVFRTGVADLGRVSNGTGPAVGTPLPAAVAVKGGGAGYLAAGGVAAKAWPGMLRSSGAAEEPESTSADGDDCMLASSLDRAADPGAGGAIRHSPPKK